MIVYSGLPRYLQYAYRERFSIVNSPISLSVSFQRGNYSLMLDSCSGQDSNL